MWSVVGLMVLVYGFGSTMLALAWCDLLKHFRSTTSTIWAVHTYGVSQIAKYLPGNILHFAGRQALGAIAGISQWALAKSTMWELALLVFSGGMLGFLALPLLWSTVSVVASSGMFILVSGFFFVVFVKIFSITFARALFWHISFLTLSALLFICLVELVTEQFTLERINLLLLIGAYVIAWLIGFVSPGAPAGIGIREMVLFFLLKGLIGESDLLIALVLGRIVTVMGDVVFFVLAVMLKFVVRK